MRMVELKTILKRLNGAQRVALRAKYESHVAACLRVGSEPENLLVFVRDFASAPPSTIDGMLRIDKAPPYVPTQQYDVYTSPGKGERL